MWHTGVCKILYIIKYCLLFHFIFTILQCFFAYCVLCTAVCIIQ